MFRLIVLSVVVILVVWGVRSYISLRQNIAEAKRSGIKYIVLPVYTFHILWLLTHWAFLPFLAKLPKTWTEQWLPYLHPEWNYLYGHLPFEKYNTDLILMVSPQKNHLFVASAASISQIVTQRTQFPKPIEIYEGIDLYGKNVVSLEGSAWRLHRKITAPSFGEKNNELVWQETLVQARELVRDWGVDKTVKDPAAGTMTLALHVISAAGFGVRATWPHQESAQVQDKGELSRFSGNKPMDGLSMSYKESIQSLLDNLIWLPMLPKWFLARSPIKVHQIALKAWKEWGKYMEAICSAKQAELSAGDNQGGLDLFGALLRGAVGNQAKADGKTGFAHQFGQPEIFGNAFVFFLAGHETTANLLHFSLVLLALNPRYQRDLQASIDAILGQKPDPSTWTYEEDFPKLFGAMPAAVLNETLRVIPAVVGIPKSTDPGKPQRLHTEEGEVTVPGGTVMSLHAPGVHQNPKYWPPVPRADGTIDHDDISKWKPDRWLADPAKTSHEDDSIEQEPADLQGPSGPDTSPSLWKPTRCAYIPFSEGYRSCLGRRFAQVEAVAAIAYIFKTYSVELAVEEWASEEEVEQMNEAEKRKVWNKAKDKAEYLFHTGMSTMITLQMRTGKVPIRLVKRGEEKFSLSMADAGGDIKFVNPL